MRALRVVKKYTMSAEAERNRIIRVDVSCRGAPIAGEPSLASPGIPVKVTVFEGLKRRVDCIHFTAGTCGAVTANKQQPCVQLFPRLYQSVEPLPRLGQIESRVLDHMLAGLSVIQISNELGKEEKDIMQRRRAIVRKVGLDQVLLRLSPEDQSQVVDSSESIPVKPDLIKLNARERKILDALVEDPSQSIADLAGIFGIDKYSFTSLLSRAYKKLGVPSGRRKKKLTAVALYNQAKKES